MNYNVFKRVVGILEHYKDSFDYEDKKEIQLCINQLKLQYQIGKRYRSYKVYRNSEFLGFCTYKTMSKLRKKENAIVNSEGVYLTQDTKYTFSQVNFSFQCIVCGIAYNLSEHHIVPKHILPYLPNKHIYNNTVIVCQTHHKIYEQYATEFWKKKCLQFNISDKKISRKSIKKMKLILDPNIPENVRIIYRSDINELFDRELSLEEISGFIKNPTCFQSELLKVISEEEIISECQNHFNSVMQPKFDPILYHINS